MGNSIIAAWEQDPGASSHPDGGVLIQRPVPTLDKPPFATRIEGGGSPPADNYQPGTPAFRYWACADALRRASDFWGGVLGAHKWNPAITGNILPVIVDEGVDLNAYYDRRALNFFHAAVGGRMVYSGESPDVVCHEFGHAILDAVRPQLWDVTAFEPPAFHESFGDMSAILTALQLPSVRVRVLQETHNDLSRASRLSRLAEQLGWAIRQKQPDSVDPDCLRNAVNSLFYRSPVELPTYAPAKQLSSEPHSFSRVFTGAFFHALSLMFASSSALTEDSLQQVSVDLGHILVGAIAHSPVVPEYFSQIGAHMIQLAQAKSPRYGEAMRTAMVRHGIVSVAGATSVAAPEHAAAFAAAPAPASAAELPVEDIDVSAFGLKITSVRMVTAGQPKRFAIAGAAPTFGDAQTMPSARVALGFFEDLIRRGRLDHGDLGDPQRAIIPPVPRMKTHKLVKDGDQVVLRRIRIDCGLRGQPPHAATP